MTDLREILRDINDQRGALTPAIVVDEARDQHHPLHHRFEWDDELAGEAYRRVQAAQLIRSVKIAYADAPNGGQKRVRGFLPVRRQQDDELEQHTTYQPTEEVLQDPFQRALVLREFDREWRRFKARYGHLAEFADRISSSLDAQAS